MALATYSDLFAALSQWLNRSDIEATYPTFIALFEARANRALRVPQMEAVATALIADNELALPSDFLSARDLWLDGPITLRAMSPQELRDTNERFTSGQSIGYAILDQTLSFAPPLSDGETVNLSYYATIPGLSVDNTTNWLMTSYPDAYLYGVLAVAYDYLRDDAQASSMLGLSDRILAEIMKDAIRKQLPAGPLVARSSVYNG
jgi:hypothetical protein